MNDIILVFASVLFGTFLSAGNLAGSLGMSLLLPLCFVLKPEMAALALVGIYCGAKMGRGEGAFVGAAIAALAAALLIPPISRLALSSGEFLALAVCVMASLVFSGSKKRVPFALASLGLGLFIPTIGIDISTGVQRYSFNFPELQGGIDFVVVALGVCCLGEIFYAVITEKILPRTQKKSLPDEAARNARSIGELIPAMSLGIPYTAETAILVGAFSLYGLNRLPNMTFSSVATLLLSAITAAVLVGMANDAIAKKIKKIKAAEFFDPAALWPLFITVAFCGAYSLNYRVFDMLLLISFGLLGLAMRMFGFPVAHFLVGLALSARTEQAARAWDGSWTWLSMALAALTVLIIWNSAQQWQRQNRL